MVSDLSGKVAVDLLSIPPLVFRVIRRKLINIALAESDTDIKFPHMQIITVLKVEGTMHPAEIGERLLIAKAQMTHLIDKLVELGLVERNIGDIDRRTMNITLTDKGIHLAEEHEKNVHDAVGEYISCLEDSELETLSMSLRNLRDILFKLEKID
jgi:DNA-binding MarR family transcriptional regulator